VVAVGLPDEPRFVRFIDDGHRFYEQHDNNHRLEAVAVGLPDEPRLARFIDDGHRF